MHYSALTHLLYNWKFVFLEYLHYFAQIPPFASGNHKSILYISECVCFQIPYISEAHHTVFVFLWCISLSIMSLRGFLHSSVNKESICNAGGPGSIPGSGRSPRKGNDNPLQYSCLENSINRGAWQATDHVVTESDRTEWLTLSLTRKWRAGLKSQGLGK